MTNWSRCAARRLARARHCRGSLAAAGASDCNGALSASSASISASVIVSWG